MLLPTGNLAKNTISEILVNQAEITRINIYQTSTPSNTDDNICELVFQNKYDIIFFYSPSAVMNLVSLFSNSLKISELKVACIGPTTEKACVNLGITPIFTSSNPDTESMFNATIQYLKNKLNKN